MKKFLYIIAIASFVNLSLTSCSEDDTVMELPNPNPNPNIETQLNISTSSESAYTGSPVIISATAGGNAVGDATIYINDVVIPNVNNYSKDDLAVTRTGDMYIIVKKTIGTIKVYAKRAGYIDSNSLSILYKQNPN